MKFTLILLSTVFSMSAHAAWGKSSSSETVSTRPVHRVNLETLGGFATTGGDYAGTFLAGVSFLVDRTLPVRLGLDSGILFGSGTGLPILLSLGYMPVERNKTATPYVGALVGPVIGLGGRGVFSNTEDVMFAILARGGLSFAVADALDLRTEIVMGGLTGIFYISPMLGVSIYL